MTVTCFTVGIAHVHSSQRLVQSGRGSQATILYTVENADDGYNGPRALQHCVIVCSAEATPGVVGSSGP